MGAWADDTADSDQIACVNSAVISVPSRPTVANATDTTACGVAELEYGLERQWPGAGANRDDLTGGLRFGLTHNLDFHWSSSDFLHVKDQSGDRTGFGDSWLGLKYRLVKQGKVRPSLGVFYQAKVPSAKAALGLGSGEVDHSLSLLVSKDVFRVHLDFNLIELLTGRSKNAGLDHGTGFALASTTRLSNRLNLVVEPYGYNSLNQSTPGFASVMAGFTYKVLPRLYLDSGVNVGVSSSAPSHRVFVGVTYAIANVYSWVLPQRQ